MSSVVSVPKLSLGHLPTVQQQQQQSNSVGSGSRGGPVYSQSLLREWERDRSSNSASSSKHHRRSVNTLCGPIDSCALSKAVIFTILMGWISFTMYQVYLGMSQ